MEIANQGEEIRIFVTNDRLVAALKEMADFPMGAIEILGIGLLQTLHERGERLIPRFCQQMHVIRHEAVGPQPHLALLEIAAQPFQIGLVIGRCPKGGLPVIPPDNHMIENLRSEHPRPTCHGIAV